MDDPGSYRQPFTRDACGTRVPLTANVSKKAQTQISRAGAVKALAASPSR